jgi:hypothetical protein
MCLFVPRAVDTAVAGAAAGLLTLICVRDADQSLVVGMDSSCAPIWAGTGVSNLRLWCRIAWRRWRNRLRFRRRFYRGRGDTRQVAVSVILKRASRAIRQIANVSCFRLNFVAHSEKMLPSKKELS